VEINVSLLSCEFKEAFWFKNFGFTGVIAISRNMTYGIIYHMAMARIEKYKKKRARGGKEEPHSPRQW